MMTNCWPKPKKYLIPSIWHFLETTHDKLRTHTATPKAGDLKRSLLVLAQARFHQFRRPRRANRHHASGFGGKETLDFRASLSACTELLHVAPRSRSPAVGDLYRL